MQGTQDWAPSHRASVLPLLSACWGPLERLRLKAGAVLKQILLLTKTGCTHCFVFVGLLGSTVTIIDFCKASEPLIKTSYSTCTTRNEAWFPTALCPPSLNFNSQCNGLSQKPGSPSHISLVFGRARGSRSKSWVTTPNLFIGWLGATNSGSWLNLAYFTLTGGLILDFLCYPVIGLHKICKNSFSLRFNEFS